MLTIWGRIHSDTCQYILFLHHFCVLLCIPCTLAVFPVSDVANLQEEMSSRALASHTDVRVQRSREVGNRQNFEQCLSRGSILSLFLGTKGPRKYQSGLRQLVDAVEQGCHRRLHRPSRWPKKGFWTLAVITKLHIQHGNAMFDPPCGVRWHSHVDCLLGLWMSISARFDLDADRLVSLAKRALIESHLLANRALGMTRAEIPLKVGQHTFPKCNLSPGPAGHTASMRLKCGLGEDFETSLVW